MPLTARPISTNNRYAVLVDDESNITDMPVPIQRSQAIRIPPIVVFDTTYQEIMTALNHANIPQTEYKLKYISIGIGVQTLTTDSHKKALEILKTTKPCFSHYLASEKTIKFVLSGLPEFDIKFLEEGLKVQEIPFSEVKMMTLTTRSVHRAKYLVYFPPNSISLNQLRETLYINNVAVWWEKYVTAYNGPTQCNNCQVYGHGAKKCYSPPRLRRRTFLSRMR